MVIIRVFSCLGELHVTVNSTKALGDVTEALRGNPLGYSVSTIAGPDAMPEVIAAVARSLQQIEGYAGGLWDHVDA